MTTLWYPPKKGTARASTSVYSWRIGPRTKPLDESSVDSEKLYRYLGTSVLERSQPLAAANISCLSWSLHRLLSSPMPG